VNARFFALVAVGLLGPLSLIAWARAGARREVEQRALAERRLVASLLAGRLDAAVELEAPHTVADEAWLRRRVNGLLKGYRPAPGETVEILDDRGAVVASLAPSSIAEARATSAAFDDRGAVARAQLALAPWTVTVRQERMAALAAFTALSREVLGWSLLALGTTLLFAFAASRGAAREAKVRQLLGKVIHAQEDERRRVARELHDETSQALAALSMKLQVLLRDDGSGPMHAALEESAALAARTIDGLHRMIADLRPAVLDDLGLQSALRWCASRHLDPAGIAVRAEFAGLDRRLPAQVETVVFRVAQEALINICRHAGASAVLIQGAVKNGAFALEVEDDGRGFDAARHLSPEADGSGWGLLGMRERVEMLGGVLRVDSAPGKGTHVALTIPLPEGGSPCPGPAC
jgi:signal transduction histidine kinase